MERYVPGAGAMAFFAIHPIDDIGLRKLFVFRRIIGDLLEPGAMAFETPGGDRPVEPGSVDVTRTICPLIEGREVRDGELKQLVVLPVQIGLSSFA